MLTSFLTSEVALCMFVREGQDGHHSEPAACCANALRWNSAYDACGSDLRSLSAAGRSFAGYNSRYASTPSGE